MYFQKYFECAVTELFTETSWIKFTLIILYNRFTSDNRRYLKLISFVSSDQNQIAFKLRIKQPFKYERLCFIYIGKEWWRTGLGATLVNKS